MSHEFEEMPGMQWDDDIELGALRLALLDQLRTSANTWFVQQYTADEARHAVAQERSTSLADEICRELEENPSVHPAAPILRDALTRLIFTFTNPDDREDTVADSPLMELILLLCAEQGSNINLQALANHLDMRSINIYICYRHLLDLKEPLDEELKMEGRDMNDRFITACNYTPIFIGSLLSHEE